jgi:hypothetical protein
MRSYRRQRHGKQRKPLSEAACCPASGLQALYLRNFLSGLDGLSINCFTKCGLRTTLSGERHNGSSS